MKRQPRFLAKQEMNPEEEDSLETVQYMKSAKRSLFRTADYGAELEQEDRGHQEKVSKIKKVKII